MRGRHLKDNSDNKSTGQPSALQSPIKQDYLTNKISTKNSAINKGRSAWKEESIREENEYMEADDADWGMDNEDTLIYPKGLSEKSKIGQAIGSS